MERPATLPCGAARRGGFLPLVASWFGRKTAAAAAASAAPPSREERSGRDHGAIRARRPRARSQRNETATGLEEEASLARPPRRVNARDASPSWKCEPAANPPPAPAVPSPQYLTSPVNRTEASTHPRVVPGKKESTPDLGRPFGPRVRTRTRRGQTGSDDGSNPD